MMAAGQRIRTSTTEEAPQLRQVRPSTPQRLRARPVRLAVGPAAGRPHQVAFSFSYEIGQLSQQRYAWSILRRKRDGKSVQGARQDVTLVRCQGKPLSLRCLDAQQSQVKGAVR
ncbi:hypothetical protein PF003_g29832 [Phytophthora fragariae]|nr:hypothetical protein PF003_g29832 [Phytophthora fragariae]